MSYKPTFIDEASGDPILDGVRGRPRISELRDWKLYYPDHPTWFESPPHHYRVFPEERAYRLGAFNRARVWTELAYFDSLEEWEQWEDKFPPVEHIEGKPEILSIEEDGMLIIVKAPEES